MLRSSLFKGLAAAGLALCLAVQPAQASEELTSSMTATCVGAGGACDVVDFTLTASEPGTWLFDIVRIYADGSTWLFGSVSGVWSGATPLSWSASVNNGGLDLKTGTLDPGSEGPLRIRVNMTTWGNAGQFAMMTYTANGVIGGTNDAFSTAGTVTPEPVTTLLLGTGLAGLIGVGRKRKSLLEAEEDAV